MAAHVINALVNRWRCFLSIDPAVAPERETGRGASVYAHYSQHKSTRAWEGPRFHLWLYHLV